MIQQPDNTTTPRIALRRSRRTTIDPVTPEEFEALFGDEDFTNNQKENKNDYSNERFKAYYNHQKQEAGVEAEGKTALFTAVAVMSLATSVATILLTRKH